MHTNGDHEALMDEKQSYVRLSISLRDDVAEKVKEIQKVTGLDRSGAISLAVQLLDLKRLTDRRDPP